MAGCETTPPCPGPWGVPLADPRTPVTTTHVATAAAQSPAVSVAGDTTTPKFPPTLTRPAAQGHVGAVLTARDAGEPNAAMCALPYYCCWPSSPCTHGEAMPDPFAEFTARSDGGSDLRGALEELRHPIRQLALGDPQQVQAAQRVLAEARRSLYLILAGAPTPGSEAGEQ